MAELPFALKSLLILGWSITGWAFLLDTPFGQHEFDSMPLGFKYSIWFFASVFLLLNCLRAYERYRKDRLANDDSEMNLRERRKKAV